MSVRPAVVDDAAALAEVVRRAITITGASVYEADQLRQWSGSFSREALVEVVESTLVFVVEQDDQIAGFANLVRGRDGRGEIDLLYVDPAFSARGIGRRAVDAVEQEARGQGLPALWADASLLAAPMLERLGYSVVERYDKIRGAVTFHNMWLVKELT